MNWLVNKIKRRPVLVCLLIIGSYVLSLMIISFLADFFPSRPSVTVMMSIQFAWVVYSVISMIVGLRGKLDL